MYDFEVACFLAGTLIATPMGEVPVESLRAGDLVLTGPGRDVPQGLLWVGRTRTRIAGHPDPSRVAPILVRAGALGGGRPVRDLRVSPEHALLLDGRLVPAGLLANGTTIVQEDWRPEALYWHLELPAHGIVWAEGAPAESYYDDGNRDQFDNHPVTALFRDFSPHQPRPRYTAAVCFPLLRDKAALDRLRARLAGEAMRRSA
ncbi:Hint domain-containing protein [Roseomonas sp. CAU 1739]|uniref:Hint domain-containing protein n=1 Tax=Roseomonas sp. CAU 1739 TaxID=3140364 RepID=UPI00325B48E6